MIIVLHDLKDNTYFVIDQANRQSGGWSACVEDALTNMDGNISADYYTRTIESYRDGFPSYDVYYYDEQPQPYEFW